LLPSESVCVSPCETAGWVMLCDGSKVCSLQVLSSAAWLLWPWASC
jgi:hypothetical protein